MMSCRDVSELVSKSMDERLACRERWAVKMHLMLCGMCRRYAKQLNFLRRITCQYEARVLEKGHDIARLSPQIRQRIIREMNRHPNVGK